MRVLPTSVKGLLWRASAYLLLALALFSFGLLHYPKKVHAGFVPVQDPFTASAIASLAGIQAEQAAMTTQITLKEIVLDGVVFGLINTLIDKLGDEVVNWINSGFEDTPMFIQDPGGFALYAADQATGRLIAEMGLEHFICDPLMLPSLQLALNLNFGVNTGRWQREYYCTFGRAASIHADTFTKGDFAGGGGWDAWVDMSVRNQNVIGASAAAGVMMDKRIAAILGIEQDKLNWNKGFFSSTNIQGYIKTPGTVIENKLNDTFDSSSRRIEVADEISEIIGTLINLAMKSLMTGLSSNNSSATNYSARYSTNVTYSTTDYQNLKGSGVLLPPETVPSNIPTLTAGPAASQVYASAAAQGPETWPGPSGTSFDAIRAIDGNKSGAWLQAASTGRNPGPALKNFWEADLGREVPLSTLQVYNITGGVSGFEQVQQDQNVSLRFFDKNKNPISFNCSMEYTRLSDGSRQTHNNCSFPNVGATLLAKSYFVTLSPTTAGVYPGIRFVRLERSNPWHLTIDEVEFFKRNGPVFLASQSTSTAIGSAFDPLLGIVANDVTGTPVPHSPLAAAPLASTTYLSYAPDGILRPFTFSAGNIVASSNAIGNWKFVYLASDAYGILSDPMERVITVRAQTTTSRTNPLILIDGSTPTATQTIDVGGQPTLVATGDSFTVNKGDSFDPFQKISARDAEGNSYSGSTVPGVRITYSRNAPSTATFLYETVFDSNKPGTWRVIFDFTDRYGATALPVLRTVTVNP